MSPKISWEPGSLVPREYPTLLLALLETVMPPKLLFMFYVAELIILFSSVCVSNKNFYLCYETQEANIRGEIVVNSTPLIFIWLGNKSEN